MRNYCRVSANEESERFICWLVCSHGAGDIILIQIVRTLAANVLIHALQTLPVKNATYSLSRGDESLGSTVLGVKKKKKENNVQ